MHWWICLLLAGAAAAQQPVLEPDTLAAIEGHVVHGVTGEPVRKVHVTLELSDGGHDSALVATTDEAGHFRFADVNAGLYKLTAEKSGFLDSAYGETKPEDKESLLKIASGDRVQDLVVRLFPGGTISGEVTYAGREYTGTGVTLWT